MKYMGSPAVSYNCFSRNENKKLFEAYESLPGDGLISELYKGYTKEYQGLLEAHIAHAWGLG